MIFKEILKFKTDAHLGQIFFYFLVLGRAYPILFQNHNKSKSAFTQPYFYFPSYHMFCVKNEK